MIRLRIAEKQRALIPLDEAIATTDAIVGIMLTHLGGMPARVGGHDLQLRRRIEQVVFQVRTEIADEADRARGPTRRAEG